MGFGYVFIGYLISFVLYLTVEALGFGGLALLLGYGAMFVGLFTLSLYQNDFALAKWSLIPLLLTAFYDLLLSLAEMFLWDLGVIASGSVATVVELCTFFLLMFFQLSLLYGIRMIAQNVGLQLIKVKAVRNSIFVGLYAVLYAVAKLLPKTQAEIQSYFSLPLTILQITISVLILLLLANCAKDICPAGEEDQPFKRSRFAIINKIGDAYERNQQKAVESTMREAEEKLRKRQEARNKKKIHHNKKRKK